jgi:hypothetical protein
MKAELKKYDKDLSEIIADMPLEKVKKLYFERAYEVYRTLWIDANMAAFKRKRDELDKLTERMTIHQRRNCVSEQFDVYTSIMHDLRCMIRSDAIEFVATMMAVSWLIDSMREDFKAYDETGDKYWYDSGKKTLQSISDRFEDCYMNDRDISAISEFFKLDKDKHELTDYDVEYMDVIRDLVNVYKTKKSIDDVSGADS